MAVKPKAAPPSEQDQNDPLLKAMNRLLERARIDRSRHQSRIADCYKYAMPWRHKFYQTQAGGSAVDLDEIFDETIATVIEDFSADMNVTFTPRKNNWLDETPLETLGGAQKAELAKPLAARKTFVFAEMGRSNLYQALQEAYMDLGPGTMAMMITDIDPAKPLHCEAIPVTELLITRGPYGYVDGVFREKAYRREEIKVLWPDADLGKLGPEPVNDEQDYDVSDGCWRDWSDKGNETYKYAVQCQGKILYRKEWKGPGSCPFIVARWSRDSTTAWGVGPTYRVLPAIKSRNHVRYLSLKNYDKHVDPITSYEDDGVINLDHGVEPGKWVPRLPGSRAPETIESKARFDVQVFEMDQLERVIRRAHYQDRPEQQGKTPPTATQWADEAAERARRMGTPATNLVEEWQYGIYRRFVYLLDQRGVLPKVTMDGRAVQLQPISPLLRAQEQEEVVRNDRWAELITTRFGPQLGAVIINIFKFSDEQRRLLGVKKEMQNDEEGVAAALKQLMPVLQNFSGAGVGGQVAPPSLGAITSGVPQ
jgi:hypothetical protein